jgi:plasmid stabilization system protein ParE
MILPVILSPDAIRDVESAAEWFEKESRSGARFVGQIQQVLDRIGPMPESHAVVYRDIRRARVPRSPFNIFYRVLAERVEIFAVVDGRREPSVWQSRV